MAAHTHTFLRMATDLGRMKAFAEMRLSKTGSILEQIALKTAPYWVPASMGYVLGGPEHRMEGALAGLGLASVGSGLGRFMGVRQLRNIVRKSPQFEKYRHLDDLALLRELKHAPAGSSLKELRGDILPLIDQYRWGGRLGGGFLGGFGMRKALEAQEKPDFSQMTF